MKKIKVIIFGGSGFVGSKLINSIAKLREYKITLVTTKNKNLNHIKVIPSVVIKKLSNIADQNELNLLIKNHDILINLVGILHENKKGDFLRVHFDFAKKLYLSAIKNKIKKFIHIGALRSESKASLYLDSKNRVENYLLSQKNKSIKIYVVKPSIIFGVGDSFISMFASIMKYIPIMGAISSNSVFQPISVNDVVRIIIQLILKNRYESRAFEIAGKQKYSFYELLSIIKNELRLKTIIIKFPWPISILLVSILGLFPKKIVTMDNLRSMKIENTAENNDSYEFLTNLEKLENFIKRK